MEDFILGICICMLCLSSCSRLDYCINPPRTRAGCFPSRHPPEAGTGQPDTVLTISAVEYPEGYDWRKDSAAGEVECRVVLLRNFVRSLSLPCGPDTWISAEMDMHHLVGGHLYTEFISGDETVIGRDGARMLSYKGREYLRGIQPEEGVLWTLGQDRSGKGWALRRGGIPVLQSADGVIVKDLSMDGDSLYFAYRDGAGGYHYFHGEGTGDIMDQGKALLSDLLFVGGDRYELWEKPGDAPLLVGPDGMTRLALQSVADLRECSFVPGADAPYVVCKGERKDSRESCVILLKDGGIWKCINCADAYTYGGGSHWLVRMEDGMWTWQCGDETAGIGRDLMFCPSGGAESEAGHFYAAFTPYDPGDGPFLFKDGAVIPLRVNGYVTGVDVTVSPPS